MAKESNAGSAAQDEIRELLRDMFIAQLGTAGLGYDAIREIVGCDRNRIARIIKHIAAARRSANGKQR
jgi:hypothetical protein